MHAVRLIDPTLCLRDLRVVWWPSKNGISWDAAAVDYLVTRPMLLPSVRTLCVVYLDYTYYINILEDAYGC